MSPYYNELPTVGMEEEVMMVLGVLLVFLGIVLVLGHVYARCGSRVFESD